MQEAQVNRWISASRVHDGRHFFPKKTYIGIDDRGTIVSISDKKPQSKKIEEYSGWLTPGFINVHCHLELSHLAGKIPRKTGLPNFLKAVVDRRGEEGSTILQQETIAHTIQEARQRGIVAFGDIANTANTALIKSQSDLYFHTFFEAIGRVPEGAAAAFQRILQVVETYTSIDAHHPYSIVPHAPYSVSETLYELIDQFDPESILCIHNQECTAETELFKDGQGAFMDFYKKMGIPEMLAEAKQISSLEWVLRQTSLSHPLILVHNTCTEKSDLLAIKARAGRTFLCLCPNANLYIENRMPDVPLLQKSDIPICLGTDSLASNECIDICTEMRSILVHFPEIDKEEIIRWACNHGAQALQIGEKLGSISIGTAPGLVHLDPLFQKSERIA